MQIGTVARCSASRVKEERKMKKKRRIGKNIGVNRSSSLVCHEKNFLDLQILLGDFVLKVVLLFFKNVDPLMILGQSGLHASC